MGKIKFLGSWALFIAIVLILSFGYAGAMSDMWEHAFDNARRQCIYDGGKPIDVREPTGEMFAVRCEK